MCNDGRGRNCHRGSRRRIVDDRLQERGHLLRRDEAAALDDLRAVTRKHDGRRPSPVPVAARKRRVRILVDADRQVACPDECDDPPVGVGLIVHDVTPVTPHGVQVEQHEAMLAGGLLEEPLVPLPLPHNVRRRVGGAHEVA